MTDFKTILLKDSRLADITDNLAFAVQSGAANNTFQQFQAVTTSNSSVVFNIQIPSESIVIDREIVIQTGITFTLTIPSVAASTPALIWGQNAALQAFPFNKLISTASSTINNTNVSINEQDVLDCLLRFNNSRELYRYNGGTPTLPDQAYLNYSDGVLTNNNPLAGWGSQSYDIDQAPRGAFPVTFVQGKYVDNLGVVVNLTSASSFSNTYSVGATTATYTLVFSTQVTEPLFLSPYIFGNPEYNLGGFAGINTINFVFNIDSTAKRLLSLSSAVGVTGGVPSATIALGNSITGVSNPFAGGKTQMLMNFLSTQASDLIPSRNVVPYMDYPRYLSNSSANSTITPGAPTTLQLSSQNIQLNQLPDYFIIVVRKPMSSQTIYDSASFLTINSISINLNNQSGLLASATQHDLWKMSVNNNSTQSFDEFFGVANKTAFGPYASGSAGTGVPTPVYTTGSILILSPSHNLSLPDYLTSSSIGQFNFQFGINVTSNYSTGAAFAPEILVICANSGIFVNQAGSSVIYTGILTKQMVVDTKAEKSADPVTSAEYKRMIGGKMNQMNSGAVKKMAQHLGKKLHLRGAGDGSNSGGKLGKYC
nr:MAG: putative major capsid protein [Lake Baikal virophage 14]